MRSQKATAPLWPDLVGGHRGRRVDGWVTTSGIFDGDSQSDEFNIQHFRANGVNLQTLLEPHPKEC